MKEEDMRRNMVKTAMLFFGTLALAAAANAATITCLFNSPTGDLGSATHTYNCGGVNITATAFGGGNLFGKNDGGDEVGIGITGNADNEIVPNHFIQLDLINLSGNNPLTLIINSNTGADRASIYNTNTAGAMTGGTTLVNQTGSEGANTLNPSLRYLDVTANVGDVLLGPLTFTVTSVPEPASLGFVGAGLLGLGLIRRRIFSPRA
jgi:hypothetical protein